MCGSEFLTIAVEMKVFSGLSNVLSQSERHAFSIAASFCVAFHLQPEPCARYADCPKLLLVLLPLLIFEAS